MDKGRAAEGARSDTGEPSRQEVGVIELGRASEETKGVCGIFDDVVFHLFTPGLERD